MSATISLPASPESICPVIGPMPSLVNEVPHRDKLMSHSWPFKGQPREIYRSVHRMNGVWWGEEKGTQLVSEYQRSKR